MPPTVRPRGAVTVISGAGTVLCASTGATRDISIAAHAGTASPIAVRLIRVMSYQRCHDAFRTQGTSQTLAAISAICSSGTSEVSMRMCSIRFVANSAFDSPQNEILILENAEHAWERARIGFCGHSQRESCDRLLVIFVVRHVVHSESVLSTQCIRGPGFPRKPSRQCAE